MQAALRLWNTFPFTSNLLHISEFGVPVSLGLLRATLKINSQIQLFTLHVHLYQEMVHDEMHSGIPTRKYQGVVVQLMVLTGVPVA